MRRGNPGRYGYSSRLSQRWHGPYTAINTATACQCLDRCVASAQYWRRQNDAENHRRWAVWPLMGAAVQPGPRSDGTSPQQRRNRLDYPLRKQKMVVDQHRTDQLYDGDRLP